MRITKLAPGETMADRKRAERLALDCAVVASVIDRNPGIPSRDAIADEAGLSKGRVSRCLDEINANETPYSRVDYGCKMAKGGPYAGQIVWGWWPMRLAAYQEVMDQADDHSARVERGVRRSRLERLAFAAGFSTHQAIEVVRSIESRLGVDVETMSETELEAFEELVVEATA